MKLNLKVVGCLVMACTLVASCEKEDTNFRAKYVGKYQVTEIIVCYGACGTCSSQKDTVIVVNYGLTDSTLNVLGRDVFIDSTGWFFAYHYGLRLWNDSIYSNFMNGGLGCGKYEKYKGYKILGKQ